eukprot:EC724585.1.p4 GENE.EC724585.1~~EC724585.1.p4  ORF type:complete len:62 (-),score=0.92 EC724585.1:247-432(-)
MRATESKCVFRTAVEVHAIVDQRLQLKKKLDALRSIGQIDQTGSQMEAVRRYWCNIAAKMN